MATSQKTVDFITDQIARAGQIRSRKMFGEYAIYCHEAVVALVCNDQLFVKITEAGRKLIVNPEEVPPYPGAKLYFRISEDLWDDHEWLSELISATRRALPAPKTRRSKRKQNNK
jgi:TfoX/Sxy family transcriptional regulator of competence genes